FNIKVHYNNCRPNWKNWSFKFHSDDNRYVDFENIINRIHRELCRPENKISSIPESFVSRLRPLSPILYLSHSEKLKKR
ncbi:hypothetical protein L9F63_002753, partial [Diploptera punctata]